jgi:hypothetical protein
MIPPHVPCYSANWEGMFMESRLLVHRQHERNAWCNNYKSDVTNSKNIQEHHIYVQALRMWFFENIPTETKLTICTAPCLMAQWQSFSRLLQIKSSAQKQNTTCKMLLVWITYTIIRLKKLTLQHGMAWYYQQILFWNTDWNEILKEDVDRTKN